MPVRISIFTLHSIAFGCEALTLVRTRHQEFERVDKTMHTLSGLLAEWADSPVE